LWDIHCLHSLCDTQTMHSKSKTHNSIAMFFIKTWRDSNPGQLSLRLMQCPLRHAATGHIHNYIYSYRRGTKPTAFRFQSGCHDHATFLQVPFAAFKISKFCGKQFELISNSFGNKMKKMTFREFPKCR
jgi:hypothetical protein